MRLGKIFFGIYAYCRKTNRIFSFTKRHCLGQAKRKESPKNIKQNLENIILNNIYCTPFQTRSVRQIISRKVNENIDREIYYLYLL